MNARPLAQSTVLSFALGAAWLLSGACGDRTLKVPGPDGGGGQPGAAGDGTAGGAAGTTGNGAGFAGTIGAAGATGAAGTRGGLGGHGGAGSTGKGGAGGSQACGPCPAPLCKQGYVSVVDPAVSCCPVCRPIDCRTVDCADPKCAAGNHLETPPGTCCPVCVAGPSEACNKGQQSYQSLRQQLVEKYNSSPCKLDSDCTLVVEQNACVSDCGTAIFAAAVSNYDSNLKNASADCASCPPPDRPPCVFLVALCSNGQCVSGTGSP